MTAETTYRIVSLGDAAALIDFGNTIDDTINKKVISLFHFLNKNPLPGMIEAVPAYSSLSVYYNIAVVKENNHMLPAFDLIKSKLEQVLKQLTLHEDSETRLIKIPVCYDGDDIEFIASKKNISIEEIIDIHSSTAYRVYMLGFLPGFPYMGKVDDRIAMPRRQQPRSKVKAGSIGIAGVQTGIYPLESPGGWQIIGHTPLRIFDSAKQEPALLQAGDIVQFYPINSNEFENY